jgi:hypothetical protein
MAAPVAIRPESGVASDLEAHLLGRSAGAFADVCYFARPTPWNANRDDG